MIYVLNNFKTNKSDNAKFDILIIDYIQDMI